jgi:hypothetical protein
MKIAILGAGLSSAYLLAASWDAGFRDIAVFADSFPDFTYQSIHLRWVPMIRGIKLLPHTVVKYGLGTLAQYNLRLGRPRWDGASSFPRKGMEVHYNYDPSEFHQLAFDGIELHKVGKLTDEDVAHLAKDFDAVFQTFPTQKSLQAQPGYRKYGMLADTRTFSDLPNMSIYNGTKEFLWTRLCTMWGWTTWEFSSEEYPEGKLPDMGEHKKQVNLRDFAPGTIVWDPKDVPSPNVFLIGRWATWNKKALAHDAYREAQIIFKEINNGKPS